MSNWSRGKKPILILDLGATQGSHLTNSRKQFKKCPDLFIGKLQGQIPEEHRKGLH
jgi:hypothetical protein